MQVDQRVAFAAFDLFFRPWRARRLATVPVLGLPAAIPADRPLLIVANHTSWWDGFLLRDIHVALRPGAPMYSVMTEAELRRHAYLRLIGGVPLQPGSAGSLRRLLRQLRARVADRADSSILFFPQGRIWPAWKRPLGFRRGIEVLVRALAPCYVLPVALHIESLNRASPTAFLRAGHLLRAPERTLTADGLEHAVTAALDELMDLLAEHGEAAPQRVAELARTVPAPDLIDTWPAPPAMNSMEQT